MLEVSQKIGQRYGLYDKACFQTAITHAFGLENEKGSSRPNRGVA